MRCLVSETDGAARVDADPAPCPGGAAALLGRHGGAGRTDAGRLCGRLRAPSPVESGEAARSGALVGRGRTRPAL